MYSRNHLPGWPFRGILDCTVGWHARFGTSYIRGPAGITSPLSGPAAGCHGSRYKNCNRQSTMVIAHIAVLLLVGTIASHTFARHSPRLGLVSCRVIPSSTLGGQTVVSPYGGSQGIHYMICGVLALDTTGAFPQSSQGSVNITASTPLFAMLSSNR